MTLKGQMKDGKQFEIIFNPSTIENPKPPRSIKIDGREQLGLPQPRKAVL